MPIMRNSSRSMVSSAGKRSIARPSQLLRAEVTDNECSRDSCIAISTAWKAAIVSEP